MYFRVGFVGLGCREYGCRICKILLVCMCVCL